MSVWTRITAMISADPPAARGPVSARAYGIGDIHGRMDLLNDLLAQIEADIRSRPARRNFIIFLGDLIDRGPDSAAVVERLSLYRPHDAQIIFLAGNHEEILLRVLASEATVLADWMRFGGAECVASYGLSASRLTAIEEGEAAALLRRHIPPAHIAFIESFGDTFRFGDYLFVHAGIRPGLALDDQAQHDLRWIREPFLSDTKPHGFLVVHGHTIVEEVEEKGNRIAIDTGACHSGILTAIVIEDEKRYYLRTASEEV